MLKWIFERTSGSQDAVTSPIGFFPKEESLDVEGLQLSQDAMKQLFEVDQIEWQHEIEETRKYFNLFGDHLPVEFHTELENLNKRLQNHKRVGALQAH